MLDERFQDIIIDSKTSIISALKIMDRKHIKLLLVLDNELFYSLLSIGEIQRAIIAGVATDVAVESILRKKVNVASVSDSKEQIMKEMREKRNEFMPIIDEERRVVDVIFWKDLSHR